ncbi:hypothetical protein ACVWY3_000530 [Bradyrhizobium sp. USDA 4486]
MSEPAGSVRLESSTVPPEYRVHAPRANWKGFLRLSLVTCPVALYPATSGSEKISFNQLNRATGHRIKYVKVDADTGDEVPNEDIVKGYQLEKDQFIEITKEELEEIALEVDAQYRDRRIRRPQRHRSALPDPSLLSAPGRESRARRVRGDPRHPSARWTRSRSVAWC